MGNEIIEEIVERTDGVPLFIEELTKAVLERADQDNRVAAVLSASQSALAVPSTLHASLIARLDRIGAAAKEVAQIGAVLGRQFAYELIDPVAARGDLDIALGRLTESGLLFCRGVPPQSSYLFKHALLQDAAYGTLLRERRRQLHAQVTHVLEQRFPETVDTQPEILAHHCTEADLIGRAVDYWRKAGERALLRSANVEAVRHLSKGLELIEALPPGPRRDCTELDLLLPLGPAMRATRGHGAAETFRVFRRAHDLMDENTAVREQISVLYGLWGAHFVGIDQNVMAARNICERCLALAGQQSDTELSALAVRLMGLTLFTMGEFVTAADYLRRTFDYSPVGQDVIPDLRYVQDHLAAALAHLSWTLFALGYPEQAARAAMRAVERANFTAHAMTIGTILSARAMLSADLGADWEHAAADAETGLAHAKEHGLRQYEAWCSTSCGIAMLQRGDPHQALRAIKAGIVLADTIGAAWGASTRAGHLAAAHAKAGDPAVALEVVDATIARAETTQGRFFEAELHRIRGEILIAHGDREAGARALQSALSIARRQQARLWELRAATSLARLMSERGRREEARALLAAIYGWFSEGFDTADLKEAKGLLAELA